MNRETKVGLLVGLGFIVLFSVVLNHKAPPTSVPPETVLTAHPPQTSDAIPLRELPVLPAGPSTADATADQPADGSAASDAAEQHQGNDERPLHTPLVVLGQIDEGAAQPAATSPPTEDIRRTADFRSGIQNAVSTRDRNLALPETASSSVPSAARIYIVRPGDNLTRIAKQVYGSGSAKYVQAIFAANRDRLTHPDKLIAGAKLLIPEMPVVPRQPQAQARTASRRANRSQQSPKARARQSAVRAKPTSGTKDRLLASGRFVQVSDFKPAARTSKRRTAGSDHATRSARGSTQRQAAGRKILYYQVRKGDSWYRLARRFLGDGHRWRELYELNRDIFPNPDRLRTGVKIRIPIQDARKKS